MTDFTVFLDLDGVLADFVGGYCKLIDIDREMLDEVWLRDHPGNWHLPDVLGCSLDEFWKPIHEAGESFWFELLPTNYFEELIERVESFVGNRWYIVSSPSRCHTSHSGKVRWIKSMFGKKFDRFMLTPHKELLAKPTTILIDDSDTNCDKFELCGGRSYVFPTVGNSMYRYSNYPLSHLPF